MKARQMSSTCECIPNDEEFKLVKRVDNLKIISVKTVSAVIQGCLI
jgi:hypothetical protein